jgi:RimJ/RimL family protein N-acetyltransferase
LERHFALLDVKNYSVNETLRDGRRIKVRALRPEDRDDFVAAVGRASSQSLYRRFFAVRRQFSEDETSFYLNVDFVNHVALVAVVEENAHSTIIAGARYIVDEPQQAEVAFTVIDAYQGQGVGAALFRHLVAIARDAGIKELVAHVLPDNTAMLRVFERSGLKYTTKRESQSIYAKLELS